MHIRRYKYMPTGDGTGGRTGDWTGGRTIDRTRGKQVAGQVRTGGWKSGNWQDSWQDRC